MALGSSLSPLAAASWRSNPSSLSWQWNVASNWLGGSAPTSGSATDIYLQFPASVGTQSDPFFSSNFSVSKVNLLRIEGTGKYFSYLSGIDMELVADGSDKAMLFHAFSRDSETFTIRNNLIINDQTIFDSNTAGTLVFEGRVAGTGSLDLVSQNSFHLLRFFGEYDIAGSTTFGDAAGRGGEVMFNDGVIKSLGKSVLIRTGEEVDFRNNSFSVETLTIQRGDIKMSGDLQVENPMVFNDGWLMGGGSLTAHQGILFGERTILDITVNLHGLTDAVGPVDTSTLYLAENSRINIASDGVFDARGLHLSVTNAETPPVIHNEGQFLVSDSVGGSFENHGVLEIYAFGYFATKGYFNQGSQGTLVLHNAHLTLGENWDIRGKITGSGSIGVHGAEPLDVDARISPIGEIEFSQSLILGEDASFECTINGLAEGLVSLLSSLESIHLDGELIIYIGSQVDLLELYGISFEVISGLSLSGKFDNAENGERILTSDGRGSFVVTYDEDGMTLSEFAAVPEVGANALLLTGIALFAGGRIVRRLRSN